jgi:glycosyltransferase involved in cell wall biosynthesis
MNDEPTSHRTLSVIIPIRNRSGVRLENCLRSLRWQAVPPGTLEMLLSDFGSSPDEARNIADLATKYDARVIRSDTDEIWNRSKALNIAIREAGGEYTLCTDADMIFEESFVSTVLGRLTGSEQPVLVVCRCRDLPDMGPERLFEREEYDALRARATMRQAAGTGACQAARTEWFHRIRGYDEKYLFWGFEDKDTVHRALKSGLTLSWIHDDTSMLHQYHLNVKNTRYLRKLINKTRYYLTRGQIVKNRRTWGTPGGHG